MAGRRSLRTRLLSMVPDATLTKRASGCGPVVVAIGRARSASTDDRWFSGSRGTMATPSRAVAELVMPVGAPDTARYSVCVICSTLAPASAARTRSTRNVRCCSGASTVQSTSTTPGVVSNTRFTCRAASRRVESSAAYTSATSVERTGGPGGISATLADAL